MSSALRAIGAQKSVHGSFGALRNFISRGGRLVLEHEARQQFGLQQCQQLVQHHFTIGMAQLLALHGLLEKLHHDGVAACGAHLPAALADSGARAFSHQQAAHSHHIGRIQQAEKAFAKVAQSLAHIVP